MDDYISLSEAQDAMTAENLIRNLDNVENGEAKRYARAAIRVLERLKPADVRPVVYCKDCIHLGFKDFNGICNGPMCGIVKPWDYCSHGVRRGTPT